MKKLFNSISKSLFKFSKKYLLSITVFGILGIFAGIIGHYGLMGFDPFAFFFFELPLYIVLIYAIVKIFYGYYIHHKNEYNNFMDIFNIEEKNLNEKKL